MVLISLQSVETDNGYQFKNDFSETIEIDPKASVSVVNVLFERKNTYIVDLTNNQFSIKIGHQPTVELSIGTGTYTATTLADEIQNILHNAYYTQGIYFNVQVVKDKFSIGYSFEPLGITASAPQAFVDIGTSGVNIPGQVDLSAVTSGTAEYVYSKAVIESTVVPISEYGGTFVEMEMDFNGNVQPTPDNITDTGGFIFGLWSGTLPGAGPTTGVKEMTDNANIGWLDSGMLFAKKSAAEGGTTSVRFVEQGIQVGNALPFLMLDGDKYKIKIAPDTQNGQGVPEYWYQRAGGKYRKFDSSSQILTPDKWVGKSFSLIIGADISVPQAGGGGAPIFKNILYTPSGTNTIPANLIADEKPYHSYIKGNLTRNSYDTDGKDISRNSGVLSQLLDANLGSAIKFRVPAPTGADATEFHLSILDENQRTINVGQLATEIISNPWYFNTTYSNGTPKANGSTNPAIFSLQFLAKTKEIYSKSFMNGLQDQDSGNNHHLNQKSATHKSRVHAANVTANWNDKSIFTVGVLAESEEMFLDVSPSGDPAKNDNVRLLLQAYPKSNLTGIKTATITSPGSGWSEGLYNFVVGNSYNNGTATMTLRGEADGTMTFSQMNNTGFGYAIGETPDLFLINIITGLEVALPVGATKPQIQIATLWTDNIPVTNNFGTTWKGGATTEGYRYAAQIINWQGAETLVQPGIDVVSFQTQNANAPTAPICQFQPNTPDSAFGNLIGFTKQSYTFDEKSSIVGETSNNTPYLEHSNLVINVDNLPIKSYIGKAFKFGSTINTNPIGSQQGITRAVAVLPRHWEENGVAGATTGPYYYDYFPYSCKLNNAVEININELEISIKNPDGTLATDITKTNLLLNITKVDNMGEGTMGGQIGNPIKAHQKYDLLDMNKTLRESYAPLGSKATIINKHNRSDVMNTAVSQGPNKTNTL